MTVPLERIERGIPRAPWRSEPATVAPPRRVLQNDARSNRRRHAMRRTAQLASLSALDAAGIAIALFCFSLARMIVGVNEPLPWMEPGASLISVVVQSVVAVFVGLVLMGAYEEGDAQHDTGRVAAAVALGLLFVNWSLIWRQHSAIFTSYVPSVLVYATSIVLVRRRGIAWIQRHWPRATQHGRTLFVGRPTEVQAAMERTPLKGPNALQPVAQLDIGSTHAMNGTTAQSPTDLLQKAIHEFSIDTTVLCSRFDDDELAQIVGTAEAAGCRVIALSRTFSVAKLSPTLKTYDHTPVVELTQPGIHGRDLVLKRAFDVIAASTLITVLSPVMLIVALVVKRTSPGPVLFRQERVGYAGRRFKILKFRSMREDAETHVEELRADSLYDDARLFKVVDDPRVTSVGHFLRRSSLDELPQLFNVLAGDMSLVGPRPPMPSEVELYGDHSYLRFDVKPGITGPWQVSGRNLITSFEEVIAIEADYVTGWTIWRDFVILARTVPVVLKMKGAH